MTVAVSQMAGINRNVLIRNQCYSNASIGPLTQCDCCSLSTLSSDELEHLGQSQCVYMVRVISSPPLTSDP